MSLGAPRGALTAEQSAQLPDVPEPPPLRARRRPGAPRPRRVQNYRSADAFDRRLRLAVLARDGMRCQLCGVALTLQTGQANSAVCGHVVPRWRGGLPVESNARAECWTCSIHGGGAERLLSGPPRPRRPPVPRPDQTPTVW